MTAPIEPAVITAHLVLVFGDAVGEDGCFVGGRLPVWNGATKLTAWCRSIVEAVDALASAHELGQDVYVACCLHDPDLALADARRRAAEKGTDPSTITLERVRGSSASATVMIGVWSDEDHGEGRHKRQNLPPNREAVLSYLRQSDADLLPSLLLDSGGGFYPWILFREPLALDSEEDRARAAALEEQYQAYLHRHLAANYSHDATHDLARVLRLAGTVNHKYGSIVRAVDLATGEPISVPSEVRRLDPSEIEDALDRLGVQLDEPPARKEGQSAGSSNDEDLVIGEQLAVRVQALLDKHQRLRAIFEGRGKPAIGADGRQLDSTSSGYDYTLVWELAKRGVTDISELATALWHRPDEAARAKGLAYIRRTILIALERLRTIQEQTESEAGDPFTVTRVRIFRANPAIYELEVGGSVLRVSSGDLCSRSRFRVRFLDALRRMPALPATTEEWTSQVNEWLAQAEDVELPPEASEDVALQDAVERAIARLTTSPDPEDLDDGRAYEHAEHRLVFKTDAVRRQLREDGHTPSSGQVCRILRDLLGYRWVTPSFDGTKVRVWAGSTPTGPYTREGESCAT